MKGERTGKRKEEEDPARLSRGSTSRFIRFLPNALSALVIRMSRCVKNFPEKENSEKDIREGSRGHLKWFNLHRKMLLSCVIFEDVKVTRAFTRSLRRKSRLNVDICIKEVKSLDHRLKKVLLLCSYWIFID